jgi:tetratricopeptide (TPR) repeat protein
MTDPPEAVRLGAVQSQLDRLSEQVETDPQKVLEAIPALLQEVQNWPRRDAYLWCLYLATQAFRFTDQLDTAVRSGELALEVAAPGTGFAASFHLEVGLALNQKGDQAGAEPHLATAADSFRALNDEAGLAWALVAEADSLCGLARQHEALDLVTEAERAASSSGDHRSRMRALKQRAVIQRQRGDLTDALNSIEIAIAGTTGHTRANARLERGHILAMSQQYSGASDDYVAANIEYSAHGDVLGIANTERALSTIDLLLGRDQPALQHLDAAAEQYRKIANASGLGYTLRERSVLHLSLGEHDSARADADEAVGLFEKTGDLLGLTGAWRAAARVAEVAGDMAGAVAALDNASRAAQQADNPLARAGVALMRAEIGEAAEREDAAMQARALYDRLGVPTGSAHAAVFAARSALDASAARALDHLRSAAERLTRARRRVVDPARRADHDLSLRSIPAGIIEIGVQIGTPEAVETAADALLESFPLGLRHGRQLREEADQLIGVAARLRNTGDEPALRAVLRRLAVAVTTLPADTDDERYRVSFSDLTVAYPEAAVLVIGAPTPAGRVPLAFLLPGATIEVSLVELLPNAVEAIDALGRVADVGEHDLLWRPEKTTWQQSLAEIFLPPKLRHWLETALNPAELALLVHPTLSHVPFEALQATPSRPLGVAAAVRRLHSPMPDVGLARCEHTTAFFDPALNWSPEQQVVGPGVPSAADWLEQLGTNTLAVFGAHGDASAGFEAWLRTTDRAQLITAADMLAIGLHGSVVVLEACWAGRHVGHRSAETLNMTTAALLAGAAAVISGLWALPANPACTGRLVADCLRLIRSGTAPAEAQRQARERMLARHEETVDVPGSEGECMSLSAPWAWAGLCVYG